MYKSEELSCYVFFVEVWQWCSLIVEIECFCSFQEVSGTIIALKTGDFWDSLIDISCVKWMVQLPSSLRKCTLWYDPNPYLHISIPDVYSSILTSINAVKTCHKYHGSLKKIQPDKLPKGLPSNISVPAIPDIWIKYIIPVSSVSKYLRLSSSFAIRGS